MGRQVILAVDDSAISKDTVRWALNSVISKDDKVTLLSVLEPIERPEMVAAGEGAVYPVEDATKCQPNPLQLERTKNFMQEVKKEIQAKGVGDVQMTTLVSCIGGSTDTGRHICEYSASKQADLLVLGSRGMGSAKRAMLGLLGLGSVSDYVVKHGCVPGVLVHKVKGGQA